MLLSLLTAASPAFALVPYLDPYVLPARRIRRKASESSNGLSQEVWFTVDGRVRGETVENATLYPVECDVPGGVAGNYEGSASGAYTFGVHVGFVSWKGYGRVFERNVVGVGRDGSILLSVTDEPTGMTNPFEYKSLPGEVWLVRKDREIRIGPAEAVSLDGDGAVSGYALRRPDGSYCGASLPYEDALPESFVWKDGVRRTLGEWELVRRNSEGIAVGHPSTKARRDAAGGHPLIWVRWRNGMLETLDFRGLPEVYDVWPLGTLSLLLVLGPAGAVIQRDGQTKAIPRSIGGRSLRLETLRVDRQGAVSVEDLRGCRWRLIESKGARPL